MRKGWVHDSMTSSWSHHPDARCAAFLDRDGVINVDVGFAHRPDDLVFTPTAVEGIRLFNDAGYWVIVVTNQSGVARGFYSESDVIRFHDHVQARLDEHGARIDAFYHCPYHTEGTVVQFAIDHDDRKPKPGMLLRAVRDRPIRREGSVMIGDRESDVQAATAAGIPAILVPSDTCDLAQTARTWIKAHGTCSATSDASHVAEDL